MAAVREVFAVADAGDFAELLLAGACERAGRRFCRAAERRPVHVLVLRVLLRAVMQVAHDGESELLG